ncbi:hypothetical protein [Mycobacterium intracellulare]|uniref:hypothetical protein n=1 Tax=Mycobacterium intracellulare TaxID=1767 RepID=UPI0019150E2F|nr:hypothetical protein [Mycobacterium intracellulare]BCO67513.1 hypothetical protein MINTM007_21240 [Mycobacterium intracellulare]BCO73048.1 hypothetical protein MINTM008_23830 [Mycobacterium intracellulare]BCO78489.1 hypothetical protein MINTM009_22710 [Mycobacterium intracellulare]BCP31466.1 hypothetical protein MINTM026_24360 [Mycobacterium intracellulare]BCP42411.1 hypothetical protein MINTMi27_25040 [Mycobacterium intracellulare]
MDLPSTEIDWEPETNTLFCTNSGTTRVQAKSTVKAREAGVVVWNADDRLKTGDLYKRLKWRQDGRTATENARAIERAVAKGYITQERDGRTVWNARGSVDPRAGQDSQK